MSSTSRSSAYPDTVQPGIPKLPKTPPQGWERTTFGEHLYEEKRPIRMQDDRSYDLVTVKRARGGVIKRETKLGKDISVKTQFQVKDGDFLISKRQIVHGACGLVPVELDGFTVSNEYSVLRGKETIDLEFLKHFSHSIFFQQACFHSSIGVHIEKMIFKTDNWFGRSFDLPPIHEQQLIAQILNTWDRSIEKTEQLIANNVACKKALVQKLYGRLNSPLKSIGDLAEVFAGGTPSTKKEEFWGGKIPWMSSGEINLGIVNDVERRITDLGLKNSSAKYVPKNSVLIALAGQGKTRGKVALNRIKLCTNQSLAAIVPNDRLNAEFLFQNLNSRYQEIRSMSLGDGGRGGLNLSIIKGIEVPLPSLEEQMRISKILSDADAEKAKLEQNRTLLMGEKSALMQQLLTGKRRVKIKEIAA